MRSSSAYGKCFKCLISVDSDRHDNGGVIK